VDHFIDAGYKVVLPKFSIPWIGTSFLQRRVYCKCPMPDSDTVYEFIKSIFSTLGLNTESCIICLVYIDRLKERNSIVLTRNNWRPVILAILIVTSKVWDDVSVWNIEFAECFPIFHIKSINLMERLMLEALDYNLYISSSQYAKYYFAVRAHRMQAFPQLGNHSHNGMIVPKPKYYVPFTNISQKIPVPPQKLNNRTEAFHPLSL
jgi:hypothetical protein